jgi:predicted phosphodiesterase
MRLQILSDLHLEFGDWAPPDVQPDLVILAGDIHSKQHGVVWAKKHFKCPVVYVLGNHEFYGNNLERAPRKLKEKAADSNVHILKNEAFILGDVRILGTTLWTDYRLTGNQPLAEWDASQKMSDFKHIRTSTYRKIRPTDILKEHLNAKSFLEEALDMPFNGRTVVVTHHAPTALSIHPRFKEDGTHLSSAYASHLERLMGGDRAALWVHGHTHDNFDYDVYGTRVVCNPRGYAPKHFNPGFNPEFTVEV